MPSALLFAALAPAIAEPAPLTDETITLEGLMVSLRETYSDTTALRADFTQLTRSAVLGDGPIQTGQITLGQPRMMRIEFEGETGSQFISDGESLYIWSPQSNQVIITPDLAEQSDGVSDLLTNLSSLQERFEVSLTSADEDRIELSLAPRSGAQFRTMALSLTPDTYQLTRLSITDDFDNTTEMRFTDLALNPELPESVFTFQAPEGATVIRADSI